MYTIVIILMVIIGIVVWLFLSGRTDNINSTTKDINDTINRLYLVINDTLYASNISIRYKIQHHQKGVNVTTVSNGDVDTHYISLNIWDKECLRSRSERLLLDEVIEVLATIISPTDKDKIKLQLIGKAKELMYYGHDPIIDLDTKIPSNKRTGKRRVNGAFRSSY